MFHLRKSFRGELKTRSGRVTKINKKINCRTSNVVYAVHCKKCQHIVYVGETETMLKDLIQNHLSDTEHVKNMTSRFQYILIQKTIPSTISDLQELKFQEKITKYIGRPANHSLFIKMCNTQQEGRNKRK